MDRLKNQRCRDTTRNTYYRIWKLFAKFYLRLDIKPQEWEDKILLFIAFLIDNGFQSSTVKTYLSALRCVLAESGIKLNDDTFLLSSLTRACRLRNDKVVHRLPLYRDLLHQLLAKTDEYFGNLQQVYLAKLYKAMFAAAYYGLLRVGEIADGEHAVLAKDVHIGTNKPKLLFVLWSSKTHCRGDKPQMIKIERTKMKAKDRKTVLPQHIKQLNDNRQHCPFKILGEYLAARPEANTHTENFFVYADNSPVPITTLRSVFKLMLEKININNTLYNLHSFRIGCCVDLYNMGVSVETIKKIGRWKSNAVFAYLRD